jgi:DNA-directed RNA polymerase specialized sigma24 family protein
VDAPQVSLRDRSHFLALVSRVMRQLLVDHARARKAAKRGGGQAPVELEPALLIPQEKAEAVVELDEALARLEAIDP